MEKTWNNAASQGRERAVRRGEGGKLPHLRGEPEEEHEPDEPDNDDDDDDDDDNGDGDDDHRDNDDVNKVSARYLQKRDETTRIYTRPD